MTVNQRTALIQPMLSHAIRYQPIVRELERLRADWVLEVGSGPEGLQQFWRGRVVGADIGFKRRPLHRAVIASGGRLPLPDHSCPLVVSCDMLEHVPPAARATTVQEMARVAARHLLLVFPSGEAAQAVYAELARRLTPALPAWLAEHLAYGLPGADEVASWLEQSGWQVSLTWYEPAGAHLQLAAHETYTPFKLISYALMRVCGPWWVQHLRIPPTETPLRVFVRAER
jgi:hypothetical protein